MKWIAPCLTLLTCLAQAEEKQQALWIWHRRSPLTEAETQQLHASRIQPLYWHIGTVNIGQTALQWQAATALRQRIRLETCGHDAGRGRLCAIHEPDPHTV